MPNRCSHRPCYSCGLTRCLLFDVGSDYQSIDFTYDEYLKLSLLYE